MHNHPPCPPPEIFTKKLPPPRGFCILAFARGGGLVGIAPEGQAFVYKQFLTFLEFSLQWQDLVTDSTWSLFVALKVYTFLKQIIQTEKIEMIFLMKDRLKM